MIARTKPYLPGVTLSINDSIKFSEKISKNKDLKEQFLGTII